MNGKTEIMPETAIQLEQVIKQLEWLLKLHEFVGNSFKVKSYPLRIGSDLRELGFVVLVKNLSVNKNDIRGHQAFSLAHELAHYIFNIINKLKYYCCSYVKLFQSVEL